MLQNVIICCSYSGLNVQLMTSSINRGYGSIFVLHAAQVPAGVWGYRIQRISGDHKETEAFCRTEIVVYEPVGAKKLYASPKLMINNISATPQVETICIEMGNKMEVAG